MKLEASIRKLESKSDELEQHRLNGTVPKDLLLPKKKALFEDQQSTVDDILQKAMFSLLQHRIEEISRKVQESKTRKVLLEKEFLLSMETSSNAQLKLLTEEEVDKIAIVKQRHTLNVRSFYSQLAIARENDFLKSKREAKKKEDKKQAATPTDTAPEAQVIDVLDQRLRQLGLIGKNSRSISKSKSKSRSTSRSSSNFRSSSRGRSVSSSSVGSREGSRGRSRPAFKRKRNQNQNRKKSVKFANNSSTTAKNGRATTPSTRQRNRGRGRGSH